jgi:hypothetical protein
MNNVNGTLHVGCQGGNILDWSGVLVCCQDEDVYRPQVNLQLVDEINAGVIARETAGIISGLDVMSEIPVNGKNVKKRD